MSSIFKKIGYITNDKKFLPNKILGFFAKWFSDETYIKLKYRLIFGKAINLKNPKTLNEKLNWLKIYYHNPMMTVLADKYWAKKYVGGLIGYDYIVPCYGHWENVNKINFDKLPDRFFLKANLDSSGGLLVDKKKGIDTSRIKSVFSERHLKRNWFWGGREWGYKHIEPCILAEEYLDEGTGHELHDYKFWCFNGKPTYMYITNKGAVIKENFYDMDFKVVDINHGFERTMPEYRQPDNFDKMKELAAILSRDIPFVRVDFFNVNGKLYFGECTFYDWGGLRPFVNEETDIMLGELLMLPKLN